jgi:hypothetical protein
VWRSLVAHTLGVRVVAGSNPAAPTKQKPNIIKQFSRFQFGSGSLESADCGDSPSKLTASGLSKVAMASRRA